MSGAARQRDKEFIQSVSIATGFLSEVETQYLLAIRLKYISNISKIECLINSVGSVLVGKKNDLLNT
ncbi:four helix bundle protein [Candidatus Ulvibacter alkanivorans]|uniref:four helix bundle protein n=1 Tax=Candidatus Ulvibacter alkanivorans TaxID=2267620 RepID=UPI0014448436